VFQSLFRIAGVQATPLPVPEVLQNLTTGLIDSFYASPLAAIALQWGDYSKYITSLPITIGVGATVITKAAWNKVTEEQRKIIEEVNEKWHKVLINKVRKDNIKSIKVLKTKKNIQIAKVKKSDEAEWYVLADKVQKDLVGRIYSQSLLDEVKRLVKEAR
jgi:TRAP-type C4-dicarboxylate transport system substrate-binding protein